MQKYSTNIIPEILIDDSLFFKSHIINYTIGSSFDKCNSFDKWFLENGAEYGETIELIKTR